MSFVSKQGHKAQSFSCSFALCDGRLPAHTPGVPRPTRAHWGVRHWNPHWNPHLTHREGAWKAFARRDKPLIPQANVHQSITLIRNLLRITIARPGNFAFT